MKNLYLKRVVALLLASLLLVVVVQPAAADDTTEVLNTRWSGVGRYGIVAQGVGMDGVSTGDILGLNVPGTVVAAYLYWEGHDYRWSLPVGDDSVDLSVDGGLAVTLTADGTYGPLLWFGSYDRIAYWKDVTSLVLSGSHNYEVSDFSMNNPNPDYSQDGAGLIVVYENAALPVAYAEIQDGLDRAFRTWTPPERGETAVNCFQFDALATPRPLDLTAFVGGIEPMPDPKWGDRPNAIWYRTGTGTTPTDMLNAVAAAPPWNRDPLIKLLDKVPTAPGDFALTASDGGTWDTYTNSVVINPGDTWACFQLESAYLPTPVGTCATPDPVLGCCPQPTKGTNGYCRQASFAGLVLAGVLELEQPSPGISIEKYTNGYDADNPTGPKLIVGEAVAWTYEVRNTGEITLYDVEVTDDIEGVVTCPETELAPGESMTCAAYGTATEGQYGNVGTVTAKDAAGQPIEDADDPSHYLATTPPSEFVPEPGSILLLGSGLAGLAGYATLRWRTRE